LSPVETFDRASLETFIADLIAHGFEPIPNSDRQLWRSPIHPALAPLTSAPTMVLALVDGWPYMPPALLVDGIQASHATPGGLVCLWRDDDASGRWTTVEGIFKRIEEWRHDEQHGWAPADLGRDARLNFRRKVRDLAVFDFDTLGVKPGGWGDVHAELSSTQPVTVLRPGRGSGDDLRGLWFHAGHLELPPRDLTELRRCLPRQRWRRLNEALRARRTPDPLVPSGGVDIVLFCWDRDQITDILALAIAGVGDATEALSMQPGPNDDATLLLRAGPDASNLAQRTAAIFGAGALGGYIALALAQSGVGHLIVIDTEVLEPGNVVRHVAGHSHVGRHKTAAVEAIINDHAPWTAVERHDDTPRTPSAIQELIGGADLVIDATGHAAVTSAIAASAVASAKGLLTAALYRGGSVARVRRVVADSDTPLADRDGDRYPIIPPAADDSDFATPDLGCSAPVNNAPPTAVLACSALAAQAAIDCLTSRFQFSDEVTDVYRPLPGSPPFDKVGRLNS
jgi:molybdopterin/thiamine biosynthesis adenylyltransferase